jgi:glutaredoxin
MSWFSSARPVPDSVPSPDRPRDLVLYKYDTCPYCLRVMRAIERLGLTVATRDTVREPGARAELADRTGRTQVPCLFVDGEALFESADIVAWLEAYAAATASTGSEPAEP